MSTKNYNHEFMLSAYDQAMKESIQKGKKIAELEKRIELLTDANSSLKDCVNDLKNALALIEENKNYPPWMS